MKTGSELLRTLAIAAASGTPFECHNVPISGEEALELLRIAELLDKIPKLDPASGQDSTVFRKSTQQFEIASPTEPCELVVNDDPDQYGVCTGTFNGEPVRVFGPAEHPATKEKFRYLVERVRDFARFGIK